MLDATAPDGRLATTIPIKVINEVFVTSVTSRPLSLDEIRGRGIVIDQNNFRAVNFQVAFNIDGDAVHDRPAAALPTPEFLQQRPTRAADHRAADRDQPAAARHSRRAAAAVRSARAELLDRRAAVLPGPEDDGGDPDLDIPPITGLVVIPGNIAFLNQFFSVLLMVTNVAPDGTPLELRETTAHASCCRPGCDRVAGTLRSSPATIRCGSRGSKASAFSRRAVVQPGPDGTSTRPTTSPSIPPQRSGEGEFLVEGLKEGSHLFDIEIEATLYGLPSGPVRLIGPGGGRRVRAQPDVLGHARAPAHHPQRRALRPLRDGHEHVADRRQSGHASTSTRAASRGAQLLSDPASRSTRSRRARRSTAKFRLIAQQTGEVTFSSFTGEAAAGGGIQLDDRRRRARRAAGAERDRAAEERRQPARGLVAAAQRVLGQAFSIATAPAEALPAGVLFVKRQTVIDRGARSRAGRRAHRVR